MPPANFFTFEKLHPKLRVLLEPKPISAPISQKEVDEIFDRISQEKPLFDGTLLCVQKISPELITTYSLSFKEYLASKHLKKDSDQHKPLAVSGWILHQERVLLGVRSSQVLFFPGFIELVPSGGIDGASVMDHQEVNFQRALETEFEEETGMDRALIEKIEPEALLFCPEKKIFDICLSIRLDSEKKVDCETSNEEYSQLFWVPLKELAEFTQNSHKKILPTSLALIQHKILS